LAFDLALKQTYPSGMCYPLVMKHGNGTHTLIDEFPIKTSIVGEFSIAMLDYRTVNTTN
jgi:hypothetical protein